MVLESTKNPADLPSVVYTSESQVRKPTRLFHAMWNDLRSSRELAWRLFVRDLSAQYRQSLFGVLWVFLPPLVTALIFILLQSRRVIDFGNTDIPYPIFVLVGTVLWQVFIESLNAPLKSVTASKPLLVKINFPREAVILSAIYLVFFNLIVKMLIIMIFFFIFDLKLTWGLLLLPVAVLMLMLLGICLGLLLTPIGLLYDDVGSSLPILTQLLFFVTPVVYSPPNTFPFSLISVLNPVSPLLIAARDLIIKGTISNTVPFIVISVLVLFLLLIAWVIYRISLPIIIERMSA